MYCTPIGNHVKVRQMSLEKTGLEKIGALYYREGYLDGVSAVRALLTAPESEFMDKVILLKRIDELLCQK